MHLLRCIWMFVALYDIDIVTEHIAGITNKVANMLSRNQAEQFLSQYPQISYLLTPLSPPLLSIVSPQKLDWTSPCFKAVLQGYHINGIATTIRSKNAAGQKLYNIFCSCTNRTTVRKLSYCLLHTSSP